MIKKLSIIIPAFNEGNTIHLILNKVLAVDLGVVEKEIIIVNDCSTDNTQSAIELFITSNRNHNIKLYNQKQNQGKGAALKVGISNATGEYIVIQDADLEYNPEEYKELLEPVYYANADVVYGSRFMGSNPHRILFFWHTVGNKFLTFLSNMFTNLNLTDMETCYKLIRTEVIKSIKIKEKRFGIEPEITAKVLNGYYIL